MNPRRKTSSRTSPMMSRCGGGLGTVRRFLGVAQEPQGQTTRRVLTSTTIRLALVLLKFYFPDSNTIYYSPQGLVSLNKSLSMHTLSSCLYSYSKSQVYASPSLRAGSEPFNATHLENITFLRSQLRQAEIRTNTHYITNCPQGALERSAGAWDSTSYICDSE